MGVMYSLLLGWRIHVCHMLVSVTLDIRKSLVVALFLCVFPNVYAAPDKDGSSTF